MSTARKRCFYCGKGWFLIQWTTTNPGLGPGHGGASYVRRTHHWICLHHTFRHLREA